MYNHWRGSTFFPACVFPCRKSITRISHLTSLSPSLTQGGEVILASPSQPFAASIIGTCSLQSASALVCSQPHTWPGRKDGSCVALPMLGGLTWPTLRLSTRRPVVMAPLSLIIQLSPSITLLFSSPFAWFLCLSARLK
jgi:hypothetical protein